MSCLGHALLEALEAGDERRALQVVARGVNLEETNQVGNTPLLQACKSGLKSVAKELVSRGANLEARELRHGFAALHLAAAGGDVLLVRHLLEHTAQVEPRGREGETPVHLASLLGHHDILELLLKAGASPNMPAADGKCALSHACYKGHVDVAQCLLRFKAKADVMDAQHRRPLHWAAEQGREAVVEVLLPELDAAALNAQDVLGATALQLCAQKNHLQLLRRLVQAKADLDLQGSKGETAVMLAALNGHVEVLQYLASVRADLNIVAHDGFDALRLSAEAQQAEATQMLLALGAQVPLDGLVLPLTEPGAEDLVLTKSLARQLLLETSTGRFDDVARRWGFEDGRRLLEAIANAGCEVPEEMEKTLEAERGAGLFDWDDL